MGYGLFRCSDDDVPDEVWGKIFKKADELLLKYLKQGKNVVNEYAWITKEWRDKARNVARKEGFQTIIIYLKLSEAEIIKRWKENDKSRKRFHWPLEEFRRIFSEFEEPNSDENVIIYDGIMSVESLLKKM
ncbi:MAG: AAA family ATPase [bacterium]|nr:MAG: AAA family ATPase [bacterium]